MKRNVMHIEGLIIKLKSTAQIPKEILERLAKEIGTMVRLHLNKVTRTKAEGAMIRDDGNYSAFITTEFKKNRRNEIVFHIQLHIHNIRRRIGKLLAVIKNEWSEAVVSAKPIIYGSPTFN